MALFRKAHTPEASEDLYTVGSLQIFTHQYEYSHNLDYSTFPILVERTYRDLMSVDGRLRRMMPQCAFEHYCTTLLNATIIDVAQHENLDGTLLREGDVKVYLDYYVPGPIGEYFSLVTNTATTAGDTIWVNIPKASVPGRGKDAGSFGELNAERHNAYECYVSPLVTRRKLEATLARQPRGDRNWRPLPQNLMNDDLIPTVNLLGYGPLEDLYPEGRNAITRLLFPVDNDSIEGRLQFSHELMARVNHVLVNMHDRYKIVTAIQKKKVIPGHVGYLEVSRPSASTECLSAVNADIKSCNNVGLSETRMMAIHGLKRKRSEIAPGFCALLAGDVIPPGWAATCNDNFNCHGIYANTRYSDNPDLRSARFKAICSNGNRAYEIDQWIVRNFRKR